MFGRFTPKFWKRKIRKGIFGGQIQPHQKVRELHQRIQNNEKEEFENFEEEFEKQLKDL